jgi:hypothetical protein
VRFALGLSLGGMVLPASSPIGFWFGTRGFYTVVESGGAVYCSGGRLFAFSGAGIWQGDVTRSVVLRF